MNQTTINQRLKFLIETLSASVKDFSERIGESTSNTNNYIGSRQLAPKHEYLARVLNHFSNVNAHWLVTGEGEPFNGEAPAASLTASTKKNRGTIQNSNHGHNTINNFSLDDCRRDLDSTRKEVEQLKALVAAKDDLIAAKDEMLNMLRKSSSRAN